VSFTVWRTSSRVSGGPECVAMESESEQPGDIYGTFDGRQGSDEPQAATPASSRGLAKSSLLLRVAGLTGVLLVAGYATSGGFQSLRGLHSIAEFHEEDGASSGGGPLHHNVALDTELNDVEQQLVDGLDAAHIREFLHAYSSTPHIAGSRADYETALYTVEQFEAFGIQTEIKEYYTLLSTPVRRRLAIVAPADAAQELNLTEASVAGDACTSAPSAEPPFLAYSPSGNVTAPVVYANYGSQQDFQWLVDQGIHLEGKIALVRYGTNYRGLKVLAALEHGMAGALLYSDPQDDGFGRGPVYPEGPWRPENSFQRGSIYNECGDPLTPGWASVLGAKYLKYEDVQTIPHLPSLPLSYGQAKHILRALRGKRAPDGWQGGLTLSGGGYHIGDDSSTVVNLDLEMDNSVGPIWDVVGTIEGSEEPEKQVILGNHRDAWVCGAIDPNSGTSVLVELGRVFGKMLQTGWRPRRTIVLASWDAEEQGLLGSTEFVEDNADRLKQEAIAYLNVDGTLGPLAGAGGSPSIAKLLFQTANAIPANAFGNATVAQKTLYQQWLAQTEAYRLGGATSGTIGPDHLLTVLGTGSDFGAFCHHLGVVSANIGFSLPGSYGTYHSTMDSIMYSELFADPDYVSHVTTGRWWGLLALRLADNVVLPFDFSSYALVMSDAVSSVEASLKVAAERYPGVDAVDFAELRRAIGTFGANVQEFHKQLAALDADASSGEVRYWNDKLMYLERHLTLDSGLPHRGWYKHVVFGPGFYDGYGGTGFPGLADGIAFHDSADAIQAHVDDVVKVLEGAAAFLLSK
jgi:N-acetylated-alpha-linked acidic dipeptidase